MFENVFEVISDHMIHDSSLEDFPEVKKYNITKVRCQYKDFFNFTVGVKLLLSWLQEGFSWTGNTAGGEGYENCGFVLGFNPLPVVS